jgi:hypothetical protein
MKARLRAQASAALASSIYMVCRKYDRVEVGFWDELKKLIKEKVERKMKEFWSEGITGGDFFISSIGPGLEVYSKYKKVETYSGKKIATKELLEYIRSICSNYIISQLLHNGTSYDVDKESQFYLAYRWTYMNNRVEYDEARKLASAIGVYIENLEKKNGYAKISRKYVQILDPKTRGFIDNPNSMIDVVNNCLLLWEKGNYDDLTKLLGDSGYGVNEAFWKYCQAIAESLLPGNKEKQLLEGFLVGRDRYSDYSKSKDQKNKLDFYLKEGETE